MHIETPESHLDPSQWLVKEEEAKPPQKNLFSSFNSFSKLKTFVQIGFTSSFLSSIMKYSRSLQAIDTKKFGDKVKAGFEKAITEAETGLGLKTNKPYKGRAPVFAIDDESGKN